MGTPFNRREFAAQAMKAIEPLVDLLLELGVSSPEAESLFRGIFVHKAKEWLQQKNGVEPSDVQIALATGIHRNFVRDILNHELRVPEIRARRGPKVDRLIEGWRTLPEFQDSSGKPAILWKSLREPSLKSLIRKVIPGSPIEGTLSQLIHRGLVRMLADGRVEISGAVPRRWDYPTAKKVGEIGRDSLARVIRSCIA